MGDFMMNLNVLFGAVLGVLLGGGIISFVIVALALPTFFRSERNEPLALGEKNAKPSVSI